MSDRNAGDELYVGFLATPPGQSRFLKVVVPAILALLGAAALAASFAQRSPGAGTWSDTSAEWRGVIVEQPVPMLVVGEGSSSRTYLLVNPGKHGAQGRVAGFGGAGAVVRGTLIERDGRGLIEVAEGAAGIERAEVGGDASVVDVGAMELRGEVIDPKCFFGAMKPGEGKGHKACATLCIQGGIPPMLWNKGESGPRYVLLALDGAGAGVAMDERILPLVAERVTARGDAVRVGDLVVLKVREISVGGG